LETGDPSPKITSQTMEIVMLIKATKVSFKKVIKVDQMQKAQLLKNLDEPLHKEQIKRMLLRTTR
jgi:uncharacterized protein (DUF1778 family)